METKLEGNVADLDDGVLVVVLAFAVVRWPEGAPQVVARGCAAARLIVSGRWDRHGCLTEGGR